MQPQVIVKTTTRPIFAAGGVSEIRAEAGAPATLDIRDIPGGRVKKLPQGDWRETSVEPTVLRCRMN